MNIQLHITDVSPSELLEVYNLVKFGESINKAPLAKIAKPKRHCINECKTVYGTKIETGENKEFESTTDCARQLQRNYTKIRNAILKCEEIDGWLLSWDGYPTPQEEPVVEEEEPQEVMAEEEVVEEIPEEEVITDSPQVTGLHDSGKKMSWATIEECAADLGVRARKVYGAAKRYEKIDGWMLSLNTE